MYLVNEATAAELVDMVEAIDVIEMAFVQLHRGDAEIFPVVMGHGRTSGSLFSVKSGAIHPTLVAGVKIGSYWPDNPRSGIPAHASTTLLLDPDTGLPKALIAASYLTALRTAASNGVAIRQLSRPDSRSLGLVGAGHQAWFELKAACAVRPIDRLRVWSRTEAGAERLAARARRELGIEDSRYSPLDQTVSTADIIITVTAARSPLVEQPWVRPDAHISAMGSDAVGKQELAPDLIAASRLFADSVEQSITLGDYETPFAQGLIQRTDVRSIGSVIDGACPGRQTAQDITLYDSSGLALQDLAIGAYVLDKAMHRGLAEHMPAIGHAHSSLVEMEPLRS